MLWKQINLLSARMIMMGRGRTAGNRNRDQSIWCLQRERKRERERERYKHRDQNRLVICV